MLNRYKKGDFRPEIRGIDASSIVFFIMNITDFNTTFDTDLTALYTDAIEAMASGDQETAQAYLKEAVRLSTLQKRLTDAANHLRRVGRVSGAIDHFSDLDRTATLVEHALGTKARAQYLKRAAERASSRRVRHKHRR